MLSKIDKRLNFCEHVLKLCQTASQKLRALERISSYIFTNKSRMFSSFTWQLGYYTLVCMFQNRSLNNQINKLHKRSLRLVHKNDTTSCPHELLEKDNTFTIH